MRPSLVAAPRDGRARQKARRCEIAIALLAVFAGVGCNAVFGIEEGQSAGDASLTGPGRTGPQAMVGLDAAAGDDASTGEPPSREAGSFDATVPAADADVGVDVDAGDGQAEGSVFAGCSSTQRSCDGGCVPNDDLHNCAACGNDCTKLPGITAASASCTAGKCSYSCASGNVDCGDAGTGCPTLLTNLCAGACGDVHNCGTCGHDCAGGDCVAGMCQPLALVTNALPGLLNFSTPDLAVGALGIFWVDDDSTVAGSSLDGGAITTYATGQTYPNHVAIDSTTVYWTNGGNPGEVMKETVSGGPTTPVTLASSQYIPSGIALDSTWVYWTGNVGPGEVSKIRIDGSNAGTTDVIESAQNYPPALALSGSNVYWTTQSNPATVLTASINGGPITTLATPGGNDILYPLTVGPTGVFWADESTTSVLSVPLTGGNPTTITSTIFGRGLVADSTYLYFTSYSAVYRVPVGGGTPVAIAQDPGSPVPIVLYGSFVYWLNAEGTVMRLPR